MNGNYVTIARSTDERAVDLLTDDERRQIGIKKWREMALAIRSLGLQNILGVELVESRLGYWSIRLSRHDGKPVAARLNGRTVAEWLADQRLSHLD